METLKDTLTIIAGIGLLAIVVGMSLVLGGVQ